MPKYIFKIYKYNDKRKVIDSFSEWITSNDVINAKATISKAFPESKNYEYSLIKIEDV